MRVAFVMPGIGVVQRGAEAFVLELGRELARSGDVEVSLFCRRPIGCSSFAERRVRPQNTRGDLTCFGRALCPSVLPVKSDLDRDDGSCEACSCSHRQPRFRQ